MATEDVNKINFYCDKLGPPRSEYFMKPTQKKAKAARYISVEVKWKVEIS